MLGALLVVGGAAFMTLLLPFGIIHRLAHLEKPTTKPAVEKVEPKRSAEQE